LDLARLSQAIGEIEGYALVELSLPGRRGERDTWGLSKTSDSQVTIFDSNYGGFRVPTTELPAFLRHINEQIRADLGGPIDRVSLRPCAVDTRHEGTPAANLCSWLATASPNPTEPPSRDTAARRRCRRAGAQAPRHGPPAGPRLTFRRTHGRSVAGLHKAEHARSFRQWRGMLHAQAFNAPKGFSVSFSRMHSSSLFQRQPSVPCSTMSPKRNP